MLLKPPLHEELEQHVEIDLAEIKLYFSEIPIKELLEYSLKCYQRILPLLGDETLIEHDENMSSYKTSLPQPKEQSKSTINTKLILKTQCIDLVLMGEGGEMSTLHLGEPSFLTRFSNDLFHLEGSLDTVTMWDIDAEGRTQEIITQLQERFAHYTLDKTTCQDSKTDRIDMKGFVSGLHVFIGMKFVEKLIRFTNDVVPSWNVSIKTIEKESCESESSMFFENTIVQVNLTTGIIHVTTYSEDDSSQGIILKVNSIKLYNDDEYQFQFEVNNVALLTCDLNHHTHDDDAYIINDWNLVCNLRKQQEQTSTAFIEVRMNM
jgi:hypothetical protein